MGTQKTKSMEKLEERMSALSRDSLRYQILESAKRFKTSWVDLGQALYSVYKDKRYKEWGYQAFEVYAAKEVGIRKDTALKLLRSYYFLEKEEPEVLRQEFVQSNEPACIPSYESIDVLRRAKDKKALDPSEYAKFKKEIFEGGKDAKQASRDLTALIRQREEVDPEEAYRRKRAATLKRFLSTLKSLKEEIVVSKLLPVPVIREAEGLIKKIESEIG